MLVLLLLQLCCVPALLFLLFPLPAACRALLPAGPALLVLLLLRTADWLFLLQCVPAFLSDWLPLLPCVPAVLFLLALLVILRRPEPLQFLSSKNRNQPD